jgi:peptide/nickel transport system permease protein
MHADHRQVEDLGAGWLMARTVARRLLELVAVLLLISFLTFLLGSLLPGDPAISILGPDRPAELYEQVRVEMGLDQPFIVRYVDWLGDAVRGDLGTAIVPPGGSVSERVLTALPVSLELAVLAIIMSLAVSVPLALISAARPGGRLDRIITAGAFGMISIPSFVAGLLLILVFVKFWPIFPRNGWVRISEGGLLENLKYAFLPALTMSLTEIAIYTRLLRNDLTSTLQEDFVLAARAKGMPRRRVLVREALRPSSLAVVTIAGVSLGRMIGATVIAEQIFGLPGLGSLIVKAATDSDLVLLQGAVLVVAAIYVLVNAAIDLGYGWLDPRVRHERS